MRHPHNKWLHKLRCRFRNPSPFRALSLRFQMRWRCPSPALLRSPPPQLVRSLLNLPYDRFLHRRSGLCASGTALGRLLRGSYLPDATSRQDRLRLDAIQQAATKACSACGAAESAGGGGHLSATPRDECCSARRAHSRRCTHSRIRRYPIGLHFRIAVITGGAARRREVLAEARADESQVRIATAHDL